jgi:hypothetical protein
MSNSSTTCAGCLISWQRLRTSCFWCGSALQQGRTPSPAERFETSTEARQARLLEIEAARRDPLAIDQVVAEAIVARLQPMDEFTHDYLLGFTGLNPCAIKHALLRLAREGKVRASGQAKLRANRFRTVWQAMPPLYPQRATANAG